MQVLSVTRTGTCSSPSDTARCVLWKTCRAIIKVLKSELVTLCTTVSFSHPSLSLQISALLGLSCSLNWAPRATVQGHRCTTGYRPQLLRYFQIAVFVMSCHWLWRFSIYTRDYIPCWFLYWLTGVISSLTSQCGIFRAHWQQQVQWFIRLKSHMEAANGTLVNQCHDTERFLTFYFLGCGDKWDLTLNFPDAWRCSERHESPTDFDSVHMECVAGVVA